MIEQERNIICSMFQNYDSTWVDLVLESVTSDMFTDSTNLSIFTKGIASIKKHGSAPVSILSEYEAKQVSDWQRSMSNPKPSISYVLTEYKRRMMADYCSTTISELMAGNPDEIIKHLQGRLDSLALNLGGDPKPASYYLQSLIAQLKDNTKVFVNTGIGDFDSYMKGFQAGQMIVIAGRPGQGKSVLATQIAISNALAGRPALMFNFEMSGEELVGRIIAGEVGINSEMIANRDLSDYQVLQIADRSNILDDVPLYIDSNTGHTMNSIRSTARKYKRQHGCEVIVVDYLQLIGEERDNGENREQLVARMSRSFKVLAKELEIPVVILAQLSRESDKRTTKEPQLSDLRESGAIEQDADVVLFVHRPETYDIMTFDDGSSTAGVVVVKVAKRRNGRTASLRLRFNAKDQRMEDLC